MYGNLALQGHVFPSSAVPQDLTNDEAQACSLNRLKGKGESSPSSQNLLLGYVGRFAAENRWTSNGSIECHSDDDKQGSYTITGDRRPID